MKFMYYVLFLYYLQNKSHDRMVLWKFSVYQWVHKKVDAIIRKIIIFKKNSFYQKSTKYGT